MILILRVYGKQKGSRPLGQEAQGPIARDKPVHYEIRVQGHLSQTWVDYLDDVEISLSGEGDRAVTTLSGQALDQSALMGLLNSLFDLGYTLIAVEYQPGPRKEGTQD
jgi:hypothetical protein